MNENNRQKTEVYRAKGINVVVSQYLVDPMDLSAAIDVLVATLGKILIDEAGKELSNG